MNNDQGRELKLSVVVVAFNPDDRFKKSVNALMKISEIFKIFVIDNTAESNEIIDSLPKDVVLIKNSKNLGIARAQNIGMLLSIQCGCEWVLTLDQDTIISSNLIKKYRQYILQHDCHRIGILSTDYNDVALNRPKFGNKIPIDVEETISSGSFINVGVYKKVGGFLDYFFVDQVDNEYCYRLRKNHFIIRILPNMDMEHRLGNIGFRNILSKRICVYNQNPIRTYYRTRNMILFARKYNDLHLKQLKARDIFKDLIRLQFESERHDKMKMFGKGLIDGFRTRVR